MAGPERAGDRIRSGPPARAILGSVGAGGRPAGRPSSEGHSKARGDHPAPRRDLRGDQPRSRIARERMQPGPAPPLFWGLAGGLAFLTSVALLALGLRQGDATAAERAVHADATILSFLHEQADLRTVRMLAAAAGGLAVLATASAGRRLLHGDVPALLAAVLVGLDPAFLAHGHLGMPAPFVLAGTVGALALLLTPRPTLHWAASGLLAGACLFDPWAIAWAAPLTFMVLLRGHIYAAPIHLLTALAQTVVVPAMAAVLVAVSRATTGATVDACIRLPWSDALLMARYQDLGGSIAMPDPVVWSVGLLVLLGMAATVVVSILSGFRVARMPGRLHMRINKPLRSLQARILWLAVLALVVPHPLAWLVIAAWALGAGLRELADDAPGFGIAMGIILVAFALVWTVRALPLVLGIADVALLGEMTAVVPWMQAATC